MQEKLYKLIDFLRENNEYYSKIFDKFRNRDLNWQEIPFLTRDQIYKYGLSGDKKLLSKNLKIGYIFSTGGTTGKPKYIAYTFEEFDLVCFYLAHCYEGIEPSDIVANLFMVGNMWASFISVNKALEKKRCTILPIAGNTEYTLIKSYIQYFKPNCIVGLPTQIMQVLSIDMNFVKKIYYGGEKFLESQVNFLKNMGCDFIRSGGYASVDADIIAYQCKDLYYDQHHIFVDHQIVEIIDINTEQVIFEYEKVGEIVVTNLDRYLCPVIRYRTGDLARWIKPKCNCNLPTIELIGRYDDWIRLASYDFYYKDLADALYPYSISLKVNRSQNILTVLIKKDKSLKKLDEEEILERLKNSNWQLKEGIENNLITVRIEYVEELPKTNKRVNVIYE